MDIRAVLILNNVGLVIAIVAMSVLLGLLIRSERKLAKYDESWFFKRKKK